MVLDFQGMDVAQATELRNRCREAGVEFEVIPGASAVPVALLLSTLRYDGATGMLDMADGHGTHRHGVKPAKRIDDWRRAPWPATLKNGARRP